MRIRIAAAVLAGLAVAGMTAAPASARPRSGSTTTVGNWEARTLMPRRTIAPVYVCQAIGICPPNSVPWVLRRR